MDDEEVSYASIGEPLYRVEAGNIEYRYTMGSILLLNRIWIWIKEMDNKETNLCTVDAGNIEYKYTIGSMPFYLDFFFFFYNQS